MIRTRKYATQLDLDQQGAYALLAATFDFLQRNSIDAKTIQNLTLKYLDERQPRKSLRLYRQLVRTYDDMGVIMATWYSNTRFLDSSGRPKPLSQGKGPNSLISLIKASGAGVSLATTLQLMRLSPSVTISGDGTLLALRRVFVLPKFEVARAAFVVERYLDTLQRNIYARESKAALLLERSCYVSKADLSSIAPMLRDIDGRGTAFMDSIDGEIERLRMRQSKGKRNGELGILVFAWARPKRTKRGR